MTEAVFTAVIYEVKFNAGPLNHPLLGCSYFGQSVGIGDSLEVAQHRWKQEIREAKRREPGGVGFIPLLAEFGEFAFAWSVYLYHNDCKDLSQEWADQAEKEAIALHGGVMKSVEGGVAQTLNLSKGGKGQNWWQNHNAWSSAKWVKFKNELIEYKQTHGDCHVPVNFVGSSNYPLGKRVHHLRSSDSMLRNFPEHQDRRDWLTSIGFAWAPPSSIKTERFKETMAGVLADGSVVAKRNASKEKTIAKRRLKNIAELPTEIQQQALKFKFEKQAKIRKGAKEIQSGVRVGLTKEEIVQRLIEARRDPVSESKRVISRRATTLRKRAERRALLQTERERIVFDQRCAAHDRSRGK